ncbi:hypothetical protein EUTSA_v10009535mg [Eutrema salsugineum]|uniref:Uncharacterized protein n=1 Tax=Eutrema salsugineum TaxID=72664 RepID=V4L1P6_EUTSA|nr:hypothetical protein EUTSA_v10009535mg [Eutrema salsugineum]
MVAGALAVADRLQSRGIALNSTCRLCQQNVESIKYVLFLCDVAHQILSLAKVPAPPNGFAHDLDRNINFLLDVMEDNTVAEDIRTAIPQQEALEVLSKRALEEAALWIKLNNPDNGDPQTRQNQALQDTKWYPPDPGVLKCNINANWRNDKLHSGGAWILRDHTGTLRTLIWAIQSLRDLQVTEVVLTLDLQAVLDALNKPLEWPRFRAFTSYISHLCSGFSTIAFQHEAIGANQAARNIAESVLRDGRFQSYLAWGGSAWLHNIIANDRSSF